MLTGVRGGSSSGIGRLGYNNSKAVGDKAADVAAASDASGERIAASEKI